MTYTEISFEDAHKVVKMAGFSGIKEYHKLDGGWANSNYILILDNDNKLVLKIWNEKNTSEVEYLLEMTNYLIGQGIPTPKPVKFESGEYKIEINGLCWTLLEYIEGEWLDKSHNSLYSLGALQAKMHLLKVPNNMKAEFTMGYELFNTLFVNADKKESWDDFLILLKRETDAIKEVFFELPRGIIHGDLFPDNVIGINGEILAFLDFEEICNGVMAFDLVMTFVGFGWENNKPIIERWSAILEGYESIRKLTAVEKKSLCALHKLATLSIAAWRYWQFRINIPDSEHKFRYVEMTERLEEDIKFF